MPTRVRCGGIFFSSQCKRTALHNRGIHCPPAFSLAEIANLLWRAFDVSKAIDEKGNRYERLLVLRRAEKRYQRGTHVKWWCQCDCGNKTVVTGAHLRNGTTRSCGCIHKLDKGEAAFRALVYAMKGSAKKRGHKWQLTREQVRHLTKQPCYYCGVEPSQIHQYRRSEPYVYNGLDRVDNTKGYTIDNVVPCCFTCNTAKSTLAVSEFKSRTPKPYRHSTNHK